MAYAPLTFPCTLDNRTDVFKEFLEQHNEDNILSHQDYTDKVLIVEEGNNNYVKSMSFKVNSTIGYFSVVYVDTKNAKAAWDDWLQTNLSNHNIECLRSAMHVAEDRDKVCCGLHVVTMRFDCCCCRVCLRVCVRVFSGFCPLTVLADG